MSENTENTTTEVVTQEPVPTPTPVETPVINNTPPIQIERDDNGLLKHIQYKFLPNGKVDWRAMVPKEFLYINPEPKRKKKLEKKYNKSFDELDIEVDKIADEDLVIRLGGIKYLLDLRGFESVRPYIVKSDENYASVQCSIDFIPNYEHEMKYKSYGDNACATLANTKEFGQRYLVEMATNRAFCRAVRNFLRIEIVSAEELGAVSNDESSNSAVSPLTVFFDLMKEKHIDFEDIKAKKIKEGLEEASSWNSPEDVSPAALEEIIKRLRKVKRENGRES